MAPPADIPSVAGSGGLPPTPAAPIGNTLAEGGQGRLPLPALGDRADIRPLDVPGGLQILIAEMRAALEEALLQPPAAAADLVSPQPLTLGVGFSFPEGSPLPLLVTSQPALAAPEAARQVVELLLQALPTIAAGDPALPAVLSALTLAAVDDPTLPALPPTLPRASPDDAALALQLPRLVAALEMASGRALAIIDTWREVPAATRDAAQTATQLIFNALSDEPLLAVWLRPEWSGFLPYLERFRRRRRRLQRRLEDPDDPRRGRRLDDERR